MMSHGLNLLIITVFGRTYIVTIRWDLSLFLYFKWDSSDSDPFDPLTPLIL